MNDSPPNSSGCGSWEETVIANMVVFPSPPRETWREMPASSCDLTQCCLVVIWGLNQQMGAWSIYFSKQTNKQTTKVVRQEGLHPSYGNSRCFVLVRPSNDCVSARPSPVGKGDVLYLSVYLNAKLIWKHHHRSIQEMLHQTSRHSVTLTSWRIKISHPT